MEEKSAPAKSIFSPWMMKFTKPVFKKSEGNAEKSPIIDAPSDSKTTDSVPNSVHQDSKDVIWKGMSAGFHQISSAITRISDVVESALPPPDNPGPRARADDDSIDIFNSTFVEVIADLGKDLGGGLRAIASSTTTLIASAAEGTTHAMHRHSVTEDASHAQTDRVTGAESDLELLSSPEDGETDEFSIISGMPFTLPESAEESNVGAMDAPTAEIGLEDSNELPATLHDSPTAVEEGAGAVVEDEDYGFV